MDPLGLLGLINQLITGGPHIVGIPIATLPGAGFRWPIHSIIRSINDSYHYGSNTRAPNTF